MWTAGTDKSESLGRLPGAPTLNISEVFWMPHLSRCAKGGVFGFLNENYTMLGP
jgi:hypothetical protein